MVTSLQVAGYAVALCGAFFYNYNKIKASAAAVAPDRLTEACSQKVHLLRIYSSESNSNKAGVT